MQEASIGRRLQKGTSFYNMCTGYKEWKRKMKVFAFFDTFPVNYNKDITEAPVIFFPTKNLETKAFLYKFCRTKEWMRWIYKKIILCFYLVYIHFYIYVDKYFTVSDNFE